MLYEVITRRLLAIPSREQLRRVLERALDETEFLSPYGLRSSLAVRLRIFLVRRS